MTDWAQVRADDFAVPTDRPVEEMVEELSGLLRSPDPLTRDRQAYSTLATWIDRGVVPAAQLVRLGDEMAERFGDSEIQARTFAPLILDCIVSAGVFESRWVEPFTRWYGAEQDLRGHDASLGWLHAVAHGADLLATFGQVDEVEPRPLLELGLARVLTPTSYVLRDLEDDRLAYALASTLTRPELTEHDATGWLGPASVGLQLSGFDGGIPAPLTNTVNLLRALYVLVDRGVEPPLQDAQVHVPHRKAVLGRLADVLREVSRRQG
ncbi:DUF2785 domain-containing protein [Kribbella deserti]|uniref:DUF2785 domain-containing protein n=1 Tax=Kribbella deserti TaxID=1926257 RepID=A0ABV6QSK7_9ACTN